MVISKSQLNSVILSVALLIFIFFQHNNQLGIFLMVVLTSINLLICIIRIFKNKHYANFIFMVLLFEMLIAIYFTNYVLDIKENSWRLQYDIQEINCISIKLLCISLNILQIVYDMLVYKRKIYKTNKLYVSRNFFICLCLSILAIFILFICNGDFLSFRNYEIIGSTSLISLYRILQVIFFVLFFFNCNKTKGISDFLKNTIFIGFLVIDSLMCIHGYRFIFVELLFLLFFLKIEQIKKIKKSTLLLLCIMAILIYLMFTVIAIIRSFGIAEVSLKSISENLFKHERSEFYTLNAMILRKQESNSINTYFNTIKNILPSILTNTSRENTGRILLKYISMETYKTSQITYGGFYLTEAFFNYGYAGIFIVNIIIGNLFCFLDKLAEKNTLKSMLIYYIFISQSYSILYYGSSNYFKIILYFIILIYMLFGFKILKN